VNWNVTLEGQQECWCSHHLLLLLLLFLLVNMSGGISQSICRHQDQSFQRSLTTRIGKFTRNYHGNSPPPPKKKKNMWSIPKVLFDNRSIEVEICTCEI
jgi:hypothetical protein